MTIEVRNKFDEQNPFEIIRAEDFGDGLFDFYEPLEKLIRKVSGVDIKGTLPVFLVGGRGTGKTMVLKYLSFEMQYKDYVKNQLKIDDKTYTLSKKEMGEFLNRENFIAIYLKFRATEYDVFDRDLRPQFLPFTALKIAERLFNILGILRESGMISGKSEEKIVTYFFDQIKVPKIIGKTTFKDALMTIKNNLIPEYETIFTLYSTYTIEEIKAKCDLPVILSKNIFIHFPEMISNEIASLKNTNFFFLCDEFEFLTQYQKNSISGLIKDSDGTRVIFKIGTRFMPKKLNVGESSEILQNIHDYRIINITDALNKAQGGKKYDYSNLIKKILNKRLAKSIYFKTYGITDIEQLFPNMSIVTEAKDLVRSRNNHWAKFQNKLKLDHSQDEIKKIVELLKYPEDPIIEKLNMLLYYRGKTAEEINVMFNEYLHKVNLKYEDLYQKNSLNLMFQLCNDYRSRKQYCGVDTIIQLSSGIIRYAIELCNQSLKTAKNYEYSIENSAPIPCKFQNMAVRHHSDVSFSDIRSISDNMGLKIHTFANEIGTIFRVLHLNPELTEPEPTHFETRYSELNEESKKIIDTALEYGILQEKPPMSPKSAIETKENDYILNRIFAPKFEISYHVRGRTQIDSQLLEGLIISNEIKRKEIRKIIIKNNSKIDPSIESNGKKPKIDNKNMKMKKKLRLMNESKQQTIDGFLGE